MWDIYPSCMNCVSEQVQILNSAIPILQKLAHEKPSWMRHQCWEKINLINIPWEEWQKRKNQINNVQDKSWSWSTKKLIGLICLYHFINNSFLLPIQRTLTQKARYYSIWSKLNYTHSLWIYPHPCFISTLPLFLSKVPWILQEIYNILNACEFFPRIKS